MRTRESSRSGRLVAIALLLALTAAAPVAARPAAPRASGVVDHVADGDTFTLRSGARVRMIGIDAPEEYFGKHDCGSKPAAALLARLLAPGTRVTLARDTIQPNRDRYHRLLRYVAIRGVPDVGLAMIRSGWAGAYPYGAGNSRELSLLARRAHSESSPPRRLGCLPSALAGIHACRRLIADVSAPSRGGVLAVRGYVKEVFLRASLVATAGPGVTRRR